MRADNAAFVQALLAKHAGVSFSSEQAHLLDTRLSSLAKVRNLESADALVKSLRHAPRGPLLDSVIEALTTHETSFFRDAAPFTVLSEQLLPALIRQRSERRSLSIWSAACSTGQEAYSLAMLLRERFPEITGWRLQLLGTDVSRAVVDRARVGAYTEAETKRGITPAARRKYFRPDRGGYVVDEALRRMVSWSVMSLSSEWPPMATFDLVLMRNVLIYFAEQTRAQILERTARHLASDGYLLLGASETTFGVSEAFTSQVSGGVTVYRKRTP